MQRGIQEKRQIVSKLFAVEVLPERLGTFFLVVVSWLYLILYDLMPASGNMFSKHLLEIASCILLIISCESLKIGRSALTGCVGGSYFCGNFEEIVGTTRLLSLL